MEKDPISGKIKTTDEKFIKKQDLKLRLENVDNFQTDNPKYPNIILFLDWIAHFLVIYATLAILNFLLSKVCLVLKIIVYAQMMFAFLFLIPTPTYVND